MIVAYKQYAGKRLPGHGGWQCAAWDQQRDVLPSRPTGGALSVGGALGCYQLGGQQHPLPRGRARPLAQQLCKGVVHIPKLRKCVVCAEHIPNYCILRPVHNHVITYMWYIPRGGTGAAQNAATDTTLPQPQTRRSLSGLLLCPFETSAALKYPPGCRGCSAATAAASGSKAAVCDARGLHHNPTKLAGWACPQPCLAEKAHVCTRYDRHCMERWAGACCSARPTIPA
jgi:hypothetical protein